MTEQTAKLLEKAEYLTEIERWKEAIPLLIKVLAQNPDNFQANCLLALCYFSLEDFGAALRSAEKAVAVAPGEEWGHRLRSIVLSEQGRKKEALEAAAEAARLAPYEPFALQVLANAYLNVNQPRQAQETAEKMREIAPESENSFFTLGNVYLARGDNRQAESCFREALRIHPNFADARNNLGVALLRQSDDSAGFHKSSHTSIFGGSETSENEEIYQHFSGALKIDPGNQVAAENLRNQFDYLNVIYGSMLFVPFLALAFLVVPGMTIFIALMGFIGVIQQLWKVAQNRRKLTPELKMFLRASRKSHSSRLAEFSTVAGNIFKKLWKPHLLAASAVFFRFLYGMPKFPAKTGWNDIAAYVLLTAAVIWLVSEITKD